MGEELIYVDRKNTDSAKWDAMGSLFGEDDLMALWVADMDFMAPLASRRALQKWAENGIFGYYKVQEGYYNSFIEWENRRHGYDVKREWLRFAPGVVSACYWAVKLLSRPGDAVMLLTPVYYPFFNTITNTGRRIARSELINTGGVYTIDFEDFENKIVAEKAAVFILCSPHNPVGRVWEKWELERLCAICEKHSVAIISDEIHHDLIVGDRKHTPAALVGGDKVITIASGSKTFNLAGLQNSFIIIPDEDMRKSYDEMMKEINIHGGNMAGYIATQAAFENGEPWLDAVLGQIRRNYEILRKGISKIPGAVISPLEGTYLAWIDLGGCIPDADKVKEIVQGKCRLAVDYGDWFGGDAYSRFIRVNLATGGHNIQAAADSLAAQLA